MSNHIHLRAISHRGSGHQPLKLIQFHPSPLLRMHWGLPYDGVITWKNFPCYLSFVLGIHQWLVDSPHKGEWPGTLRFSWIFAWTNVFLIILLSIKSYIHSANSNSFFSDKHDAHTPGIASWSLFTHHWSGGPAGSWDGEVGSTQPHCRMPL